MAPHVTPISPGNSCLQQQLSQSFPQTHRRRITASLQKEAITLICPSSLRSLLLGSVSHTGNNAITITRGSMLQNPQSGFYLKCYYHKIPDYEMKTSDSHSSLTPLPPLFKIYRYVVTKHKTCCNDTNIFFDTEITVHYKPWKQIEALDCTSALFCTGCQADIDSLLMNERIFSQFSEHNFTGHIKRCALLWDITRVAGLEGAVPPEPQRTYTCIAATIWKIIILLNV